MTTLTLLTKINDDTQLKLVGRALNLAFEGLEVETKILGAVAGGWVQIVLSGEDEGISTNYVIKEVGLCPSSFESVKKFSTLKGYIKKVGKNREALSVDVGVFQPKTVYATIPLRRLQGQLVDGRKIALKKIEELFGLCEGLPVSVKVVELNKEESRIDAELSSKQIRKYGVWRESLLDRLLVLGASLSEVEAAIERVKLKRDVIDVETLGLLEHALTCKLGTDAAGLIPKIGRTLKNARFSVFNQKTVMNFLNLPK
jgi:hypothetical protein